MIGIKRAWDAYRKMVLASAMAVAVIVIVAGGAALFLTLDSSVSHPSSEQVESSRSGWENHSAQASVFGTDVVLEHTLLETLLPWGAEWEGDPSSDLLPGETATARLSHADHPEAVLEVSCTNLSKTASRPASKCPVTALRLSYEGNEELGGDAVIDDVEILGCSIGQRFADVGKRSGEGLNQHYYEHGRTRIDGTDAVASDKFIVETEDWPNAKHGLVEPMVSALEVRSAVAGDDATENLAVAENTVSPF